MCEFTDQAVFVTYVYNMSIEVGFFYAMCMYSSMFFCNPMYYVQRVERMQPLFGGNCALEKQSVVITIILNQYK